MAQNSGLAPTGYTVATTGVGQQTTQPKWLQLFSLGLDAYVDIETAGAPPTASTPDGGDVSVAVGQNQPDRQNVAAEVVSNLTTTQWMMLGVAGVLTVGLFSGWFR